MTSILDELRLRMEAAAEAGEFEEAARLRDQLSVLRGQTNPEIAEDFDSSRLKRQVPGRMGLGTSEQAMVPPPGWKPPPKPDAMTTGVRKGGRRKR